MNILILSSAMTDSDFDSYPVSPTNKPNPSNQNFYSKLIKSLAFDNDVTVVSLRPLRKGMVKDNSFDAITSTQDRVQFYYSEVKTGKFYKALKQANNVYKAAKQAIKEQNYNNFIIVVDTLRPALVTAARKLAREYKTQIVGVLTDNPRNLSHGTSYYKRRVVKRSDEFDGYIALTSKLNQIFNKHNRPCYQTEGFVDDIIVGSKLPIGDYMFFAGSIYEKYGVKTMIEAYTSLNNCPYKLVIAGNGELRQYLYDLTERKKNILYLSLLDKQTIYNLEHYAVLNINPRPYSKTFDEESVPSKLLEYFASGTPTLSTRNTVLEEKFGDSVLWTGRDSKEGLRIALEEFLKMEKKELNAKAQEAMNIVYREYGLKSQGTKMTKFLNDLQVHTQSHE